MKNALFTHSLLKKAGTLLTILLLSSFLLQAQTAYIANSGDGTVSVINVATGMVTDTILVGQGPFAASASPDGTKVYISDFSDNRLLVVNTATNMITDTIMVDSGPVGGGFSPSGSTFYVANFSSGSASIVDAQADTLITNVAVGNLAADATFSPDGSKAYVSSQSSNWVIVFDASTNQITDTIFAGFSPTGIGLTPDGSSVYIVNRDGSSVSVADASTNQVTTTIQVGNNPLNITTTPDGSSMYVTNGFSDNVMVIDVATNTVVDTIAVGGFPVGISITPDGSQVYVSNRTDDNVMVIDVASNTVVDTIAVGDAPESYGDFISIYPTNLDNALDFDGINDRVEVPNGTADLLGNTFTISGWVFPRNTAPSFPDFDGFFGWRNEFDADFYILQLGPDQVEARFRNSAGTNFDITANVLTANTWQHLALTYDGSTLTLYHNGTVAGSTAASGDLLNPSVPFDLGNLTFNTFDFYFDGQLDEVRYWNTARSEAEIMTYMSCELEGDEPGLVAYYPFNQGVPGGNNAGLTTLFDATSNANDGTLFNFTLDGPTSNWVAGQPLSDCNSTLPPATALDFDGVDDYIDCGNIMPTSYTKEVWVNVPPLADLANNFISGSNTGGDHAFWCPGATNAGTTFQAYKVASGHNQAWNTVVDPDTIPEGWVHYAVTYDSASQEMKLYKNGVMVDQASGIAPFNSGKVVYVGNYIFDNTFNNYFGGEMDEVRIWEGARSQAEIMTYMNCELSGTESNLVAYYNLNQGVAGGNNAGEDTAIDQSSNGNDGALLNFALTGLISNWIEGQSLTQCDSILPPATALAFDGIDDHIDAGDILPASYTKEAWINIPPLTEGPNNVISGSWTAGRHVFWIPGNNGQGGPNGAFKVSAGHNGDWVQVIDPDTVPAGWVHFALTYDSTSRELILYKNGMMVDSAQQVAPVDAGGQTYVGTYFLADGTGNPYKGELDEIRIWEGARSQLEIMTFMNCELVGDEAGLVAYYNFNQGIAGGNNISETMAIDGSPNANNGMLENFALNGLTSNWIEGQTYGSCDTVFLPASALDFDGVNDHVILPTGFAQNFTAGTISGAAWVYLDENVTWATIIKNWGNANWGAFHFGIEIDSLELAIEIQDGAGVRHFIISPDPFPLNQWVHTAFTADGDSVRLYEDGVKKAAKAYDGKLFTDFPATYIGAKPNDAANGVDPLNPGYWNGRIDELSMWDRALSEAEIQELAGCSPDMASPGLVAYYSFDQGFVDADNSTVSSLIDDSGNGNDGTLTDFALTGSTSNWAEGNVLPMCTITSIEEYFGTGTQDGVSLAPNPVMDRLNVLLDVKQTTEATFHVFDVQGRMVQLTSAQLLRGEQSVELDVKRLSSGLYFLNIQVGEEQYSTKFVKTDQ